MMPTDNKEKTFMQSGLVLTTDDALSSAIVQKVKLFTPTRGVSLLSKQVWARCGTHGGVHIRRWRTPAIEVNHFSYRRSHIHHEPKALKKIKNKNSPLLNLPCMIKIILHLCTHISYRVGEFFGQRIPTCFSILDEVKI